MTTSFNAGIAAATEIAAEYGLPLEALRPFASNHLHLTCPDLDEIGTSDVSIHLSWLGNHHANLLRSIAQQIRERDDLIARVSAATGRTAEETLINLQRLFAPADTPTEPTATKPTSSPAVPPSTPSTQAPTRAEESEADLEQGLGPDA